MARHTPAQAAALEAAQEKALTLALELDEEGKAKHSIEEIADQVLYSTQAVGQWLAEARRSGVPIPKLAIRVEPKRVEARRLRDKGHSLLEISEALGVSVQTAYRYVGAAHPRRDPTPKEPDPEPPPPSSPKRPPLEPPTTPGTMHHGAELPPVPDDPAEEGISTLVSTKRLQVAMLRAAQAAERDGMHAVAQRFYRDATNLSGTITRLEGMAAAEKDGIHVTQAEIDQAWAKVEAAILAITDRPLLCSECSRNLSITWAGRDSIEP